MSSNPFCVTLFCRKVDGFPRKIHFSCIWSGAIPRKQFSSWSTFSLQMLEMDFLWGGRRNFVSSDNSSFLYNLISYGRYGNLILCCNRTIGCVSWVFCKQGNLIFNKKSTIAPITLAPIQQVKNSCAKHELLYSTELIFQGFHFYKICWRDNFPFLANKVCTQTYPNVPLQPFTVSHIFLVTQPRRLGPK